MTLNICQLVWFWPQVTETLRKFKYQENFLSHIIETQRKFRFQGKLLKHSQLVIKAQVLAISSFFPPRFYLIHRLFDRWLKQNQIPNPDNKKRSTILWCRYFLGLRSFLRKWTNRFHFSSLAKIGSHFYSWTNH